MQDLMVTDTKRASQKVKAVELNFDCWSNVLSNLSDAEIARHAMVCQSWRAVALKFTAKVFRFSMVEDLSFCNEDERDEIQLRRRNKIRAGLAEYILARASSLETIIIYAKSGGYFLGRILEAVRSCKTLRILDLTDNGYEGETKIVFPKLPASLRILRLDLDIDSFAMESQAEESSLKMLDCNEPHNLEACKKQIPFEVMSGLHSLKLWIESPGAEALSYIAAIGRLLKGLKCLHLDFENPQPSSEVFGHLLLVQSLQYLTIETLEITSPCSDLLASHSNLQTIHLPSVFCTAPLLEDLWRTPQLRSLLVSADTVPEVFPNNGMSSSNLQVLSFCNYTAEACEFNLRLLFLLCPNLSLLEFNCTSLHTSTSTINLSEIPSDLEAEIRMYSTELSASMRSSLLSLGFQIIDRERTCMILFGHTADRNSNEGHYITASKINQFSRDLAFLEGLKNCFQYKEASVYRQFQEFYRSSS